MKNKTLIFTLAAIMFASFALAPAANAIVAPIVLAIPLAGVVSLFGLVLKHFVAPDNDHIATADASGASDALAKEMELKETAN